MARILVIDDDRSILELLRSLLTLEGHEVESAADGREGLRRFREEPADLVVTDLMMPEVEGIEMIRTLRAIDAEVPILAMSGDAGVDRSGLLRAARHLGASRTLPKPFANQALCDAIRELLEKRDA